MYDQLLNNLDAFGKPGRGDKHLHNIVCEQAAAAIRDLAAKLEAVKPRPLSEIQDGLAVILRLNRDNGTDFGVVLRRYPDGLWREDGSDRSCLHFDDTEPAIPLSALTALEK